MPFFLFLVFIILCLLHSFQFLSLSLSLASHLIESFEVTILILLGPLGYNLLEE